MQTNFDDDNNNNTSSATRTRPFTVRGKRNQHKTYTFVNFSSARQGPTLFQTAAATLAEKQALYDRLVQAHQDTTIRVHEAAARGEYILGVTTADIPIHFLTVDNAWAREKLVDWNHVADMAMNFRPKSLAVPSVAVRRVYDDNGELVDIIFSLTDGVHRTTTLKERGFTHVTVSVQLVSTIREEAEISSDCNYNRRSHSGYDILKNRLSSEEERAADMARFLAAHGFAVARPRVKDWPHISATPTIEKIMRRYGETTLGRVLSLFADPENAHWFGNDASLRADMLAGWALYVHEFERPGFIHSAMTSHLMRSTTPTLIVNLAEQITKPLASAAFNREMCASAKDLGSEDGRAVKVCTALVRQVSELFKPSKRPKTAYTTKFKTLFDLYYSADLDRESAVFNALTACARRGLPHYWTSDKNGGLTR
jgi:hypothetical protein